MNAVDLQEVFFGYHQKPLLCDFRLSITAGEWLGIVGPNGAGKSTLLKLIANILQPWSGNIMIFDRNLKELSRREIARLIAYVPQESHFAFEWKVEDIVMMGRHPYLRPFVRPAPLDWKAVNEAMELTGVISYRYKGMNELSAGERQRVIIARALAQETDILLLDEATSHLDLYHRTEILRLLHKLSSRKKTVVSVVHDLNEAFSYCSRVAFMKAGSLVSCVNPEGMVDSGLIIRTFGITPVIAHHPVTGRPQFFLPGADRTTGQ
ncbi:MAG: ABC transporter ATP-binding protein [candidate division WOR-3 bacterium]|uniref:ABC transporter ATP-binding protein n=1 Tax=candidate division WOR-3 bacterium TaxID=2052148 RepID=A0A7C1NEL8_UNCW3|nr:ABC transporter ATP-binding protein [candidate division WOR-3 bacterium]